MPTLTPQPTPIAGIVTNNPNLGSIANEDTLDLLLVELDDSTAITEIDICDDVLKLRAALNDLTHEIERIPYRHFDPLFVEATKNRPSGENYITGLQISLGMLAGTNKITPIYTPLYIKKKVAGVPTAGPVDYKVAVYCKSYYYTMAKFEEVTGTPQNNYIGNYANEIRIKHHGDANYKGHIKYKDTDSIIFPFQTIYALEHDNPGISKVFLYNSIREEVYAGVTSIKHCILLSPEISVPFNSLSGKFANRSHLCPPDCDTLTYIKS